MLLHYTIMRNVLFCENFLFIYVNSWLLFYSDLKLKMINGKPLPQNHGGDILHYRNDAISKRISYIRTKQWVNFFQLKCVLEEGLEHDHIIVNTTIVK